MYKCVNASSSPLKLPEAIIATCGIVLTFETVDKIPMSMAVLLHDIPIVHFTAVCLVTLPLSGSKAAGDLVLIQTFLVFYMLILLFSC